MGRSSAKTYVIVPRPLADDLYEGLVRHFGRQGSLSVGVVVDRRRGERRRVKGSAGARRVADRREDDRRRGRPSSRRLSLPTEAKRWRSSLRFWDAEEPGAMAAQDADTLRLVARIKAGDRAALVGLYVRYYEPLCRYARMVLRDDHEAEDIAQQTFLSAQSALKRYEARDATPFRAWLFGITRNKLRREVARRQAITPSATDAVDTLRDRAVTGADELASRWLTNWDLAEAIETLPGPHRQVLALRFLLDLSRADVAALLGRSEGAVQQLQRRALDELSRRMAQSWIRPG